MKPDKTHLSTDILEKLLEEGQKNYARVIELLKSDISSLPEYDKLLDQEMKLNQVINQIINQIQARKIKG